MPAKLESIKLRTCKSLDCEELNGSNCKAEDCIHLDVGKALKDRRKKLKEGKKHD